MRFRKGFSRSDLTVTVICVIFLVIGLGIVDGGARRRAKEALCLSKLHKWGGLFHEYANDNDGKLMDYNYYDGEFMEHSWVPLMYSYHGDFDLCLCPSTTKTWRDHVWGGPYIGWDFRKIVEGEPSNWEWFPYYEVDGKRAYGSYGKNSWVADSCDCDDNYHSHEYNYDNIYLLHTDEIPVLGDCEWAGGSPYIEDQPIEYEFRDTLFEGEGEINRFNLARHGLSVNMCFLDWSARKVGLRELWMLKWSRQEGWGNTSVVPDPDEPSDWPEWMRD